MGKEKRKWFSEIRQLIPVVCFLAAIFPRGAIAQKAVPDSLLNEVTLRSAIGYALKKQPTIQQAALDEQITESQIRSKLSDWYPHVNFGLGLQHNFQLPVSFINGNAIPAGVNNTSAAQFSASQILFNRDVLLARRTKGNVILQSKQQTENDKITLVVNITKAFYDVLTTAQQIKVADENIRRTERSLKDATAQYKAGIADKTDYKRATISLNNIRATKRSNEELEKAKLEYLKSLMNYPESGSLNIVYDSAEMEREIFLDTLQKPDYHARVEYRILETEQNLLKANLAYNRWGYLPSVSANGGYNLNFQNNNFTKLYGANYPNSFAGITLALPIFQGGKRKADLKTAELQLKRNDLDMTSLRNTVNTQYATALAGYQSSLENYLALKQNVALAQEVYDVIQLQYRSGIKSYLEVITAETDLRTAQINYFNALYSVLVNKVDVQRALGQIIN